MEREEPNRLRIDDIEETWGELKARANQIITATGRDKLYDGLVKTVPEKEIITKKNENSANRGGSQDDGYKGNAYSVRFVRTF